MKFAVEQALALAGRAVKPLVLAAFSLVFRAAAFAAITTEAVEYKDGDPVLEGFAADDDANAKARPGLLPIHASDRATRPRATMLTEAYTPRIRKSVGSISPLKRKADGDKS
jgi:hypothetical protein